MLSFMRMPFIRGQRPEHTEQERSLRRGGIHLLGQGAKGHALRLESRDNLEEMRQRAAEPVEFPDHQTIAGVDRGQCLLEAESVIPRPARLVGTELVRIHPRLEPRVALQVCRLPIGVARHPHVADEHVRKTPLSWLLNGFCRKVRFLGQNPKIGSQEFKDLQTPRFSKKQLCDRTIISSKTRGRSLGKPSSMPTCI